MNTKKYPTPVLIVRAIACAPDHRLPDRHTDPAGERLQRGRKLLRGLLPLSTDGFAIDAPVIMEGLAALVRRGRAAAIILRDMDEVDPR